VSATAKLPHTVDEVLSKLHVAGVQIRVEGGRIVAKPRAAISGEIEKLIRANRDALLTAISSGAVTPVTQVTHSAACGGDDAYTLADLQEMDRLLRDLAQLEGWSNAELQDLLDQRQRMAPANVPAMLQTLRLARGAALAPWPDQPAKRSRIRLCFLTPIPLAVIDNVKEAA